MVGEDEGLFIEDWTELFCCSLWSAKVLEYEYGI